MANNIRIIRRSKNLRLKDVADRMQNILHETKSGQPVSPQYIGQIERGKIAASEQTLKRIAKALRVRVELLTQEGLKLELVENA